MRPVLYISGPYFSADHIHGTEGNILNASKIALEAWRKGWAVICPHKNTAGFHHATEIPHQVWLDGDLAILLRCDAILMIPGYNRSTGARMELDVAETTGIPVYYYEKNGVPEVQDQNE